MPFDGREQDFTTKPDADLTPRKRGYQLARELRNLPASHVWSFAFLGGQTECGSAGCACGYARARWPSLTKHFRGVWEFGPMFGMTDNQALRIFGHDEHRWLHDRYTPPHEVTPTMVADAIEAALDQ